MSKLPTTKERLNEAIIQYGAYGTEAIDTIVDILAEAGMKPFTVPYAGRFMTDIVATTFHKWEKAPCTPEGFTAEQEKVAEAILDFGADMLMACYLTNPKIN